MYSRAMNVMCRARTDELVSPAASVRPFDDGSVFDDEDQPNNRSAKASVRAIAPDWVVASR
jgi:hypothetical protein